jgi:tRNA(Arg) A34 adenosine deaminase TadA
MERERKFILEAIELSRKGMLNNQGGPFGCIVAKGDTIVGRGNNQVTSTNDPTAHAEIVAIRDACSTLGTFQLEDCEIYTSCEPCPMCMGAIYWARPKKVFYANTRVDAANIGFDDSLIYDELVLPHDQRKIAIECIGRDAAIKVFEEWSNKTDKINY